MSTFYDQECATSPCAKDKMRKRLGPKNYIEAQAMYQLDTFDAMYLEFKNQNQELFKPVREADAISLSKFKSLAPWNLKPCKQETCLCKACENFGLYEQGLFEITATLKTALSDANSEEHSYDCDPIYVDQRYKTLTELNKLQRRIEKVTRSIVNSYSNHRSSSSLAMAASTRERWVASIQEGVSKTHPVISVDLRRYGHKVCGI